MIEYEVSGAEGGNTDSLNAISNRESRGQMSTPRWRAEADLPVTVQAVPLARQLLDELLTVWYREFVDEEQREDARLVLSELVTNAVHHAHNGRHLRVHLESDNDGQLYIAVDDGVRDLPALRELTQHAPDGRGLHIVQELSTRWGTRQLENGGKRVWAELPNARTPARSV